jgi:hypothetical protein
MASLIARNLEFLEAVCQGNEEKVKGLIQREVDICMTDRPSGCTAGHYAIERGHRNILRILLQRRNLDPADRSSPRCRAD